MWDDFWLRATLNSLTVVLGVCAVSWLLAVPSAWLIERTDLPGARLLARVFTLCYALPSYLLAIAWIALANPGVGWLNLLAKRLGITDAPFNIYHLGGVILVEASILFTILFFAFRSGLRQMDPALEEAALLSGASRSQVFFKITLPLLTPHLTAGTIAVALASLASFGVPAMIGAPARIFVLTTAIYSKLQEGSAAAFDEAMLSALAMAVVTLALVLVAGLKVRKKISLIGGRASRPAVVALGRWRRPLAALLYTLWSGLILLPVSALVLSSFFAEPGILRASNLSLRAWRYVLFTLPELGRAARNSLLAATSAALLVIAIAAVVSILAWRGHHQDHRGADRLAKAAENGAIFFYSLPGTVLALGLIIGLGRLALIGTLGVLILAYVVKYTTLGLQTVRPSALLIDPSMIEAGRLAGAGVWTRLRRLWLPLLKTPLLAAALLVFMPCFSELTMSLLLYGPGTETLGVVLFQLQEYADRSSAAVIGTLLLLVLLIFGLLAERWRDEP